MIRLTANQNFEGSGLFLQNHQLRITKTLSDYIYVEQGMEIVIEEGVQARIVDLCSKTSLTIILRPYAEVEYQILSSVDTTRRFECSGHLHIIEISTDASKERLDIHLLAEQATANVELLSLAGGFEQSFIQQIEHQAKHTESSVSNFGVVMDHANILFDTTGKIQKGMAKSKCAQLSKGIIMDDDSVITSKPILLIDEYDVVANHGASIGKMSDECLFYLMSRGLSKQEAFFLILEGIIRPFIDKIVDEELKQKLNQRLELLIKR